MTRWRCIRLQASDVAAHLRRDFKPSFQVDVLVDGRRLMWDSPYSHLLMEEIVEHGLKPPADLFSHAMTMDQARRMEANLKNSSFRGEEWWPECV